MTKERLQLKHLLDPHLSAVREDVARVEDDLRWAYADAWWPTASDPLAPSRGQPPLEATPGADPDVVRGPKYALGMGDDATRAALGEVLGELAMLEVRLAAAVFYSGRRPVQPGLVQPGRFSSMSDLEQLFAGVRWRLEVLAEDGPLLVGQRLRAARQQLAEARRHADLCVRSLGKALSRGGTGGVAHAEPRCRVCGIRPQAQRERQVRLPNGDRRLEARPSKGGRCDTCAQWFSRNGNERPVSLDTVDDARAAADRRRRRGEGWGSG